MNLLRFLFFSIILGVSSCTATGSEEVPDPNPPNNNNNNESGSLALLQDEVNGQQVVLAGSQFHGFIVSFERKLEDGTVLSFSPVQDELPIIMSDNEGNEWDLFGKAVKGPRIGQELNPTKSCMGYWFAFGAMYPGVEIHQGATPGEVPSLNPAAEDWLIPTDFVFRGSGFDAIQSLENPVFENYDFKADAARTFYVGDDDLVVGLSINGETRAYPHSVLDWHEILNDEIDDTPFALVYCPLTGTATVWDRNVNGELTTFGVSGLLYNSNVIPFDRSTESLWTQLDAQCVNGELKGADAKRFSFVEMKWQAWRQIYRFPKVLSVNQGGGGFDYTNYPYDDYRTNHNYLAYPITFDDDRLPRKERVHGLIVDGKAKVYTFESFK